MREFIQIMCTPPCASRPTAVEFPGGDDFELILGNSWTLESKEGSQLMASTWL